MAILFGCSSTPSPPNNPDPEPGIPLTLATERAASLHNIRYALSFRIPEDAQQPIWGRAVIRFAAKDITSPVVLDFNPGAEYVETVLTNGTPSKFRVVQDHIIIPAQEIASGTTRSKSLSAPATRR
jgi:hypothetical protein